MLSVFVESTDLVLEIPAAQQAAVWAQSRAYTSTWGRWNAYLNQLCLKTILPWFQADFPTAKPWVAPARLPLFWDLVNGAVITVGEKRIALMPTEAIDRSELAVPQEWLDLPSWAADYYLGVQVSIEAETIEIYGYTTHQQLKTQGSYDPLDRTYCLEIEAANTNLNALWLTLDRYPVMDTRAALAPIPAISDERITPLIERLGNPAELLPRLAVPFPLWAAILEQPELHHRLYQQRQGAATPISTRLNSWLQGQIETAWQTLDLVLSPRQITNVAARGDRSSSEQTLVPDDLYRAKLYSVAGGQIALVIGIAPIDATESRIDLQIHPAGGATQLPGATSLRLLTATGGEIGQASASVTETIKFQFRANVGEKFQVEIACAGQTWIESFEQ